MSHRIRKMFLALILASTAVLGQTFWSCTSGDARSEDVVVTTVYDGDTLVVSLGGHETTIRLIGVDAPETSRPDTPVQFYGPEATDFTRASLEGKRVRLEFEPPDRAGGSIDRYGRSLAYVITGDGRNFNLELVRLGYGRAYTRYPFRYMKEFLAAEESARAAGLGMWAKDKKAAWSSPEKRGRIIGNIRSHIYHLQGQYGYETVAEKNKIYFRTEEEAEKAGYRKAKQ
jgi:micrococcal nuclease